MAEVLIEYQGKRKTIDDADPRYDALINTPGVKIVQEDVYEADASAPAADDVGADDDFEEPKPDPNKPTKRFGKVEAFGSGAGKFLTGGYTDAAAGAGAALGTFGQALVDKARGFDTHPIDQAREAYTEGAKAQRDEEEQRYQEEPEAYGAGAVTGALTSAPLGSGKTAAQTVARSAGMGGLTGFGMSEGEDIWDDLANAYIGTSLGGAAGVLGPVAASTIGKGVSAVKKAAPSILRGAKKTLGETIESIPGGKVIKLGKNIKAELDAAKAAAGAAAPTVSPAPAIEEAAENVASATRPLSAADDLASQLDEIDQSLIPEATKAAPAPKSVTPTDPTVIKSRTPAQEAALPQRQSAGGKDFSEDLAEAQRILKEGVPEPKLKRTPEEWATASEEEMIGAIEDAAQRAQVGKRLPNAEQVRAATGLDKKTFARLYPQVRAKVFPRPAKASQMRAVPKAKAEKPAPASPAEAAADDIDDIEAALGGSPIPEAAPTAEAMPDPALVEAFIAQGQPAPKAVEMAKAVMRKEMAPPASVGRQRASAPFDPSAPKPKAKKPTGRQRASAPFKK